MSNEPSIFAMIELTRRIEQLEQEVEKLKNPVVHIPTCWTGEFNSENLEGAIFTTATKETK